MTKQEGILEEFANWGGGTKTARPASVGPHDRDADQHDPSNPGINPEKGYKPAVGATTTGSVLTRPAVP